MRANQMVMRVASHFLQAETGDLRHSSFLEHTLQKPARALAGILALLLALSFLGGQAEAGESDYQRSIVNYQIPDVVLVNQNGEKVRLNNFLTSDKPVVVDFIFCTCTTICPFLSSSFISLQHRLGKDYGKVRLVSISIDPEHDTPKLIKEYMKRFGGKPGWDYLTGSRKDIDSVMRAFDAYVSDKMSHKLLTLIRSPRDGKWTRITGTMSTSEFMSECRKAGL